MTIKDTFGIYHEVETTPETWTQLYQSGLLHNNILDLNNLKQEGINGHYDESHLRNRNS